MKIGKYALIECVCVPLLDRQRCTLREKLIETIKNR